MINTALCDIVACARVRADCRSDGDRRCRADADREQDHRPNHGYDGNAPDCRNDKKTGMRRPARLRIPGEVARETSPPDSPSRRLRAIFDMMQRLDLTDNERAILITALRRLVDFDPLSPQTQALKAILERLDPQKPQPIPDTAGTG